MSALRLHKSDDDRRADRGAAIESSASATSPAGQAPTSQAGQASSTDSIKSWLDVLEKLLPISDGERRGIRDELASHLRERVRDLTLSGVCETEAIRTAISELGDAAELAKSYSNVKSGWAPWARSNAMKIAATSVVIAGFVIGGVALRGSGQDAVEQQQATEQANLQGEVRALKYWLRVEPVEVVQVGEDPNVLVEGDVRYASALTHEMPENVRGALEEQLREHGINLRVTCDENMSWNALFESIADTMKVTMLVNWDHLGQSLSIQKEDPVQVALKDADLETAMEMLSIAKSGDSPDRLDYRVHDGTIEFSTRLTFDQREKVTRTFNLDALVSERVDKSGGTLSRLSAEDKVCEDVAMLVRDMVNRDMWVENGGDLATIRRYGAKIFVTAPKRHFQHIEWVLKEIGTFEQQTSAAGQADVSGVSATRPVLAHALALLKHDVPVTQPYALKHANATIVRDALGQLFNAAPALKECGVTRVMSVNDNVLEFTATANQVDVVSKIIKIVDAEHPADTSSNEETRSIKLHNTTASGMVQVMGRILNAVPSLKECNIGRGMSADDERNAVTVVSTPGQGAIIIKMMGDIDSAVSSVVTATASR